MHSPITRRRFLKTSAALTSAACAGCATFPGRRRLDDAFPSYVDAKTGAKIYNLTPGAAQDNIVYQTHPMWTPGMRHLLFTSEGAVKAVEMATGAIRPILATSAPFAMQWNSGNLCYMEKRDLYRLDVPSAFSGTGKPEKFATLPAECLQPKGGLSVDATGDTVYTGAVLEEEKRWSLIACTPDGWRTIATTDFNIGHLQANPHMPGAVMFCWETGGDAPQRTWIADGKSPARPAYKEVDDEWVTHEAWWGPGRIIFTIWPYDDKHKALPHGVACCNLNDGRRTLLAQYPAWHTHGSPDGRWALGDDFQRNIWLIDANTLERRLLTQGHLGPGCKTHPHASFTPDSRAIVLNSSRSGNDDILYVPLPEWESLPKAQR